MVCFFNVTAWSFLLSLLGTESYAGIYLPNYCNKYDYYQPFLGLFIADLKEEKAATLQYVSWTSEGSGMQRLLEIDQITALSSSSLSLCSRFSLSLLSLLHSLFPLSLISFTLSFSFDFLIPSFLIPSFLLFDPLFAV